MKRTEDDLKMFVGLHGSSTGAWLIDYVTRLTNWVCDVRCPVELETKARVAVADFITENLAGPIQGTKLNAKDKNLDSYE